MKQDGRKVREDLTAEELARLARSGSIGFASPRDASRMSHGAAEVFIPSKEQH